MYTKQNTRKMFIKFVSSSLSSKQTLCVHIRLVKMYFCLYLFQTTFTFLLSFTPVNDVYFYQCHGLYYVVKFWF
jgi:hypothetical protein